MAIIPKDLKDKMLQLYNEGYNDADISRIIKKSKSYVFRWRTNEKLTAIKIKRKSRNKGVEIPNDIKDILVGTLLGDGSIQFYPKFAWAGPKIKIDHGLQQRDYAIFLYKILKFSGSTIRLYKRKNTNQLIYTILTKTNPAFFEMYNSLYINGRKTITSEFLKNFTSRSLAYLYMDDGFYRTREKNKAFFICTDCFTLEEQQLLAKHIKSICGIVFYPVKHSTLYKGEKRFYYRLKLNFKDKQKFINLIKPYMIESLKYKLGPFAE